MRPDEMNLDEAPPMRPMVGREVRRPDDEDLDNLFNYHAPNAHQTQIYGLLRDSAKAFAHVVMASVPDNADRRAAIRKIREAVMTANAGIATDSRSQ